MMLAKAEALIPLGTQTFSKSKLMFPEGAAPLFVTHGDGAYVFDVDGNDYVDCVGGLLPISLATETPMWIALSVISYLVGLALVLLRP